jgi:hypothetical protein
MAFTPNPFAESPPPQDDTPGFWASVGDAGKEFAAGAANDLAGAAGTVAAMRRGMNSTIVNPDDRARDVEQTQAITGVQDALNEVTKTVDGAVAPANARAASPSSVSDFLKAPVRSTIMSLARSGPSLLGALFLPEGWAGVAAGSAFFGTQGVADQINQTRQKIMGMSEDDLMKSPVYQKLRESGDDDATARGKLIDTMDDAKTLLMAGGANALAGGLLGHALKGQAAKGFLKSVGVGALDAGTGMGIAGGGSEAASEQGDVNAGLRTGLDPATIAASTLNSAVQGAVVGAGFGGVAGLRNRPVREPKTAPVDKDTDTGRVVDPNGPAPAEALAIDKTLSPVKDEGEGEGTLSQQIEAERQKAAQAAAKPPAPPTDAPTTQPAPQPVAPVPSPAPARQAAPSTGREPPIPLPPTDRQLAPRPKRGPPERMAVPLEEEPPAAPPAPAAETPPVTPTGNLTAEEVRQGVATMPQKEVPAAPPVPEQAAADALNQAAQVPAAPVATVEPEPVAAFVEKPQPAAPAAPPKPRVTGTLKAKPRVLKAAPEPAAVEAATVRAAADGANAAKLREEARLAAQAQAKAEQRQRNKLMPNEERAKDVVTGAQPTDAEDIAAYHNIEQAALGVTGHEATETARTALRVRSANLLAAAENAGVRIPTRTPYTKALREQGVRNPTPYLSRLIEIKKFLALEKRASAIPDAAQRRRALDRLYQSHVMTERAMRAGDLDKAAERRLQVNEERDAIAARKKAELEELTRQQQADAADEERNSAEATRDESDARRRASTSQSNSKGKPAVEHTTAGALLKRLSAAFHPAHMAGTASKARAVLLRHILGKFIERVGNTPVHIVHDEQMRRDLRMNPADPNGRAGFFHFFNEGATSEGHRGEIYIDGHVMGTHEEPITIVHEVAHAAVNHAIDHNPRLHAALEEIRQEADAAWAEKHGGMVPHEYGLHALYGETHRRFGRPDVREFAAEGIANPRLRRHLTETPASPELLRRLGLESKPQSLWRAMVSKIAKAMGLGEKHVSLLDALLHKVDEAMDYEPRRLDDASLADLRSESPQERVATSNRLAPRERAKELVDDAREKAPHLPGTIANRTRKALLKFSSFDQAAQAGHGLFGEGNLPTKLSRAMATMAHAKQQLLDHGPRQLVRRMADLERRYRGDGGNEAKSTWEKFADLLHDETMAGVFADKDLAAQKGITSQGKAQHADLAASYRVLPDDLKQLRADLHAYLRRTQNEASLATIKNIVRDLNDGKPDDALAQRIFDRKYTDEAEKKVVERSGVLRAIQNARALNKIKGPYVMLMRHGDHVVEGRYKIATPANALRLNDEGKADPAGNVYQFNSKAEAQHFAADAPVHVLKEQRVYVDPQTNERFGIDHDGTKVKLTKEDVAANTAEEKWRVTLQPKHVEFFENEVHARQRHAELSASGLYDMDGIAPKRWEPTGPNATFVSHEFERMINSLRQQKSFQERPEQERREIERYLRDVSLQSLGSTRAQSRRLPRTFVAGASHDLTKNTTHYASSMAGFLARQEHMPKVAALLKQMTDYEREHRFEDTSRTYPRGQVLRELTERVHETGEPTREGLLHRIGSRLLQMSMLDKLASPAFHVINSIEPWTTSFPVLSGRYGVGRTLFAMNQAYRDIGATGIVGAGAGDTARAFRSEEGLTNYVKRISDRLKKVPDGKYLRDMLDEMHTIGIISKDAGMEIGRMTNPSAGVLLRGLDRADLMARQMGTAIESINRAVTGIAAYRLEYAKTKDHVAAKDYAIQTVIDTMGDYSGWNAAPVFNHPLGRLALQFKKFGQKTYYLLGKTAHAALKGDKEAMKQFAGLLATHGLLAGALGLPLEPIKVGLLAAQLLGTGANYGDFEQFIRKQAAGLLGNAGGEIATRGLPRYLGVDLSTRIGLDNLLTPPQNLKSLKTSDIMAYAGQMFAGAPLSMLSEYPAGLQALWNGDPVEAARRLVPLKLFADTMQAYQRVTVGKQTPSGRESLTPYSPAETAVKVLGFTPGRDAETSEMRAAIQGDQQQFRAARQKLVQNWVNAAPGEKMSAWRSILQWNAGQPAAAQIRMAELSRDAQRRASEERNPDYRHALRSTARDRHIRAADQFYNVQ